MFSTFDSKEQLYLGVEAKILVEKNFLKRVATTELAEYTSVTGMRKFIEGIYKKRGLMIGYIIEGSPGAVVEQINKRIEADSFYSITDKLVKTQVVKEFEHTYCSNHISRIPYSLPHLFLDFSLHEL